MSRTVKITISIVGALVLLGGVLFWLDKTGHIHLFSSPNKVSVEEIKAQQAKKAATANNPSIPTSGSGSTSASSSTNSSPSKTGSSTPYSTPSSSDSIILSAAKSNSSTVAVSTKLNGYSDGSCKLTVTNGSQSYTQTAQVIFAPDFSTCAGFSVPISQLGTGTWTITLDVVSGGTTTSKTINFEVS